jgi:hypothetical protein
MNYSREEVEAIDTAEGHQTLIRLQWREFAAFAWREYLSLGRGAIVVDLKRAAMERTGKIPTYYVADQSEKLRKRGGWPNDDVEEIIESYDPEQDVVFLFIRLNSEIYYYNVTDERTPPEA